MKKIQNNNSGFTLVETMVTMLIFSMLIGGLYATAAVGENSWQVNQVRVELQQELRKSMEWMKYDLQETGANAITNVPADGSWYPTITFKKPTGVSGSAIAWNLTTTQFVLGGANSNQLQRIDSSGTTPLAHDVQILQFRRQVATSDILEIAMIGQKTTVKGDPISYQLAFQVQLRN